MIAPPQPGGVIRLGLRENLGQFGLLVLVNAFVGAMVGLERSILPAIADQEFHLVARTAMLSFIVVFGVAKALTNYGAGRLSDRWGRKHVLVAGWLVAARIRRRWTAAGHRDGDGVSGAARRHRRRRPPCVAGVRGGRVSPVA